MNKTRIIFALVIVIAIGLLIFLNFKRQSAVPVLYSQTSSESAVTVKATPKDLSSKVSTWDFEITFDTHSGSLEEDLVKVAVLVADGREFFPISWDGSPPGGHHREGVLKFKPISPLPKTLELKIKEIGGEEKNFQWSVF